MLQRRSLRVYCYRTTETTEKYYIVTPNPELLVIANNDNNYKDILKWSKISLA